MKQDEKRREILIIASAQQLLQQRNEDKRSSRGEEKRNFTEILCTPQQLLLECSIAPGKRVLHILGQNSLYSQHITPAYCTPKIFVPRLLYSEKRRASSTT